MGSSWVLAGATAGLHVRVSAPQGYTPDPTVLADAGAIAATTGGSVLLEPDPHAAVAGADVVVTDTWVTMGKQDEKAHRVATFGAYQVTSELMSLVKPDAIFLAPKISIRPSLKTAGQKICTTFV